MEELVKLMDELSLALKAHAEAGIQTQKLAQEVLEIPKISVLAPYLQRPKSDIEGTHGENKVNGDYAADEKELDNSNADAVIHQLEQRLELQNLLHVKEEALETLSFASKIVSQIRQGLNENVGLLEAKCTELMEEYDHRILAEKNTHAEYQQRKQDLILRMVRKADCLENLLNQPI